jgi:hypothetical protein
MDNQWSIKEVSLKLSRIAIVDEISGKKRFVFVPHIKSAYVDQNKIVALTPDCGYLIDIFSGVQRRFDPTKGVPRP